MPVDQTYLAENAAELLRMRSLIDGLTDDALARPMPAGWTVAAVLAHIGLWDARIIYLLEKWAGGADPSPDDRVPEDLDWVNDSAKPLCLALPPRVAAQLALRLAADTDREVAAMNDELRAKNLTADSPVNLLRAEHRKEHLDDIEVALRL